MADDARRWDTKAVPVPANFIPPHIFTPISGFIINAITMALSD